MLTINNQQFDWQLDDKELPTIDFLDCLTITSYGKLRKLLLDYGKRYMSRIQIIFGTLFMFILIEIISVFIHYIMVPQEERSEVIEFIMNKIIPNNLPILILLLGMLGFTA